MDVLPYLSLYLIVYTVVINGVFLMAPAPYGKFSQRWILNVPGTYINGLLTVGFFACYAGWIDEDWAYKTDFPTSARGWFILMYLTVFFAWRTFVSHMVYACIVENTKESSVLILVPYLLYYVPVGFYFRRCAALAGGAFAPHEYVLMAVLVFLFAMNAYADVSKNLRRKNARRYELGRYLNEREIFHAFSSFVPIYKILGLPPNYSLELIHWFVFVFLTNAWEGWWWFVCCAVWLITRGIWQRRWYATPSSAPVSNEPSQSPRSVADVITF